MTWSRWRWVRRGVQVAALLLFVVLLFSGPEQDGPPLKHLFFHLDPLAALSGSIASRALIPSALLALVTLGLTVLLGRVWCGWLCPMGTLLEWFSFRGARKRAAGVSPRWRNAKYVLLLLVLSMALFAGLSLLILDPLVLLTRTLAVAIVPALNRILTVVVGALLPVPGLGVLAGWLDQARTALLPLEPAAFAGIAGVSALFAAIVALNALAGRFWCRYLCPLGGLLGWVSKVSRFRVTAGTSCSHCARCAKVCRLGAIEDGQPVSVLAGECTLCLDCLATCPKNALALQPQKRPDPVRSFDPSRRELLGALAAGAAGMALLRTGVSGKVPAQTLLRPPGALPENAFLARCLRCGECMKACPTSGLQPALFQAGLEGLWTPVLTPRLGYCDYGCNVCGQVCPAEAIPPLSLEEKRRAVIGVATVDRNRCLPWAYGKSCIVCEEMCPVPEKAIILEEVAVTDAQGQPVKLQRPVVRRELCLGCGICERRCPLEGEAAIHVVHRTPGNV